MQGTCHKRFPVFVLSWPGLWPTRCTPGAELSYEPSFAGEYHFIVVAPDDVQLTVTKEGAGSRTGSEYESIVAQFLGFGHADSRAMRLGGRDRATIRVRGNGCALLLIFEVSYR